MPRTQKQYEEIRKKRKDLLKNAALQLFVEKGFHATSVSEIALNAGVAKGLLYNYYESKEALLGELFSDLMEKVSFLLNPDSDEEITTAEMATYCDRLIESLEVNREYWILYYKLVIQPDVFSMLMSGIKNADLLINYNKLLNRYFEERFENPALEMLMFLAVTKGFSAILLFNPGWVSREQIPLFKARLCEMFIREKKKQ